MQIQTKHRERLRAVIRERLYRFRIEQLKDQPNGDGYHSLDCRLDRLMGDLEREALDVLKVPARKKPKR